MELETAHERSSDALAMVSAAQQCCVQHQEMTGMEIPLS